MEPWEDMTPSPIMRPRRRILLLERRRTRSFHSGPQDQFVSLLALEASIQLRGPLVDGTTMRVLAESESYAPNAELYSSRRMTTLRRFERLRRLYAACEDALFSEAPIDVALCNGCPDARYTADLVFHYLGRDGAVAALTVETFDRARRGESLHAEDRLMPPARPAKRR